MQLVQIPAQFIDKAWADGASALSKACDASGGEIEGPQLKMMLSRGERHLLRMNAEGKTVGWGVVRIDQLPNLRVLMVTDLVAPHGGFQRFLSCLEEIARAQGCSRIRCAAKPAQARLYAMKAAFQPVYTILEREVV